MRNDLIELFKKVPGAISVAEGIALYKIITENLSTPMGIAETFVDLGSYAGKSSLIGVTAINDLNRFGAFIMVEPAYNPKGSFRHTGPYFAADNYVDVITERASTFITKAGLTVFPYGTTSEEFVMSEGALRISYAFVDTGEHSEASLKPELDYLDRTIRVGGLIVFHDYGNQYSAPVEAAKRMVSTGRYKMIDIDWDSINKEGLEDGNDSWHMVASNMKTINFIGAIKRI